MELLDIHTHSVPCLPLSAIQDISSKRINELRQDGYYSMGIHPWYIDKNSLDAQWDTIVEHAKDENVLALGETGLDKLCNTPVELQQAIFIRHIELSEQICKPLIIHNVKSNAEILQLKIKYSPCMPWIIHGFRGNRELASQLLHHGLYLSYGEYYHEDALASAPLDRIFIETDESQLDIHVLYARAALLRGLSVESFTQAVQENIQKVFFSQN
jgi:TatD DNase family protein